MFSWNELLNPVWEKKTSHLRNLCKLLKIWEFAFVVKDERCSQSVLCGELDADSEGSN